MGSGEYCDFWGFISPDTGLQCANSAVGADSWTRPPPHVTEPKSVALLESTIAFTLPFQDYSVKATLELYLVTNRLRLLGTPHLRLSLSV